MWIKFLDDGKVLVFSDNVSCVELTGCKKEEQAVNGWNRREDGEKHEHGD